jgi:hypothetical protein
MPRAERPPLLRQFKPIVLILAFAAAISLALQQWWTPPSSWRSPWAVDLQLSGISGVHRGRGTEEARGADVPRGAGWVEQTALVSAIGLATTSSSRRAI